MRLALLLCLILAGAAPFFFIGGPSYHSPRSYKAVWNLGHILFFGLLSYLFFRSIFQQSFKRAGKRFTAVFMLCLLLGTIIELLQSVGSSRTVDFFDIMRNQLGCLLGFTIVAAKSGVFVAARWLRSLVGFVLVCLLVAGWPLTRSILDERIMRQQFPVLSDFETLFERGRWVNSDQLRLQKVIVRHGKRALRVQLTTATYSGTSLFYFPGNWKGYRNLHFSVYNPMEAPLELHCRIHDRQHKHNGNIFTDRFHRKFRVSQGWSDLHIPLEAVARSPQNRCMDMENIEGLSFFVIQQPQPRVMYLDHLYLSR